MATSGGRATGPAGGSDGSPDEPASGPMGIGVDVGGSGIKTSAVDLVSGELVGDRVRVATPNPAEPQPMVKSIARIVARVARLASADAPVGVGVPCVVIDGVTKTAANIDPGWIDFTAQAAMARALSRTVTVVNDADAAGVAEMRFGAGRGRQGVVIILTLGTGVGSAIFVDGTLVPNTELGHMEIRGRDAERRSAAAARQRRDLSWTAWASDLDEHLLAINRLFSPALIVLGGGVSKNAAKFLPKLSVPCEIVPAQLRNDAGIVGAAILAAERSGILARPTG